MPEIAGFDIPVDVPNFGIGTGKLWIFFVIFMFSIVISIVVFVLYQYRIYNKKIVVFENIAGQGYQPVFKDRARVIKLGDSGEEIFFLKKKKVYRTAYGKKMGKNTYWFCVGQDGYWYNVVLGDVDAKMGMLDVEPIDRDMRYMNTAVRKNIQERYKKMRFMEKYGTIVMSGIFLLIILIGIWFLLDKIAEINSQTASAIQMASEVQSQTAKIISSLDSIVSRSGIS